MRDETTHAKLIDTLVELADSLVRLARSIREHEDVGSISQITSILVSHSEAIQA